MPNSFSSYSRGAAQVTFDRLKKRLAKGSWLGRSNRYAKDCIENLKQDCLTTPHQVLGPRQNQLAEYIAASVPTHCMDGWAFLGKAILSHVTGDTRAAKHFSYYAQLRAVMSLLAAEGIGVLDRHHFGINSANRKDSKLSGRVGNTTHALAQTQFNSWAQSPDSADLFEKIIQPSGITLEGWFNEISGTKVSNLAQAWLNQWGYDLATFKKDQEARNEASYRPSGIGADHAYRSVSQIRDSINLVENIWQMCAANGRGGFVLDAYLLRRSWEKFEHDRGQSVTEPDVNRILTRLGINDPELSILTGLFTRTSSVDDPLIIKLAEKRGKMSDPDYHMQMMSRATLLLRLASGAANQMLKNASISKGDIQFWWSALGENCGLWESGTADPIADMWVEVDDALQNIGSGGAGIGNHYKWRTDFAAEVLALSGCERIGLMQMCL